VWSYSQALNERLLVSNNDYIRTTEARHKEVCRSLWRTCKEKGDIYFDHYKGWYLVREERFITDQEAQEWNYVDKESGVPLKKMSEPSFFFKLSKYAPEVLKLIQEGDQFLVQPEQYRKELIERLSNMEMRDLSISRGTFDWGIPCPEDPVEGKEHVMYVWFDALINYVSAVNGLDASSPLSRFWSADAHVVGKDIMWFHSVIWPAMLLSAGVPLPKSVVVHGFVAGADGRKMSKSLGNVVDPHEMLNKYPADTIRWYLCREAAYGDDPKFSEDSLKLMHNADLLANLGNLVNRGVNLCGGEVPSCTAGLVEPPFDLAELKKATITAFANYRLSEAAELVIRASSATNKWIADLEPWKMKDASLEQKKAACLRLLLEAVYVLAHFFAPFIPTASEAIFKKLGSPAKAIPKLSDKFDNLTSGTVVTKGSVLFQELEAEKADAKGDKETKEEKAKSVKQQQQALEKGKAKGKAKPKKEPLKPDNPEQPVFSKLDIRVGQVMKAWNHPEADKLYVEEIDIGDPDGPRTIVSGLRDHYPLEQFEGRKLLVVCNMAPRKMRKVTSSGMVLCAKCPDTNKVELLEVPADAKVGDRIVHEDLDGEKWRPVQPEAVGEYAVWETVAKELKTRGDRIACFADKALKTIGGASPFLAATLADKYVS